MQDHQVLDSYFDQLLERNDQVLLLGKKNNSFICKGITSDLLNLEQALDAAISATSLVSLGIEAAIRGLKPIVELQNLNQVMQVFITLADELFALRYHTSGKQKTSLVIRVPSKGARIPSSLGAMLQTLIGIDVLVPREVRQAIGFYNTMLKTEGVAIILENFDEPVEATTIPSDMEGLTTPIGVPEILLEGRDITVVTYGVMCDTALEAASYVHASGISCEVIDVQTLKPFDLRHCIATSVRKSKNVVLVDEDPLGGVATYLLQLLTEEQGIYHYLESQPKIVTSGADTSALLAPLLADQYLQYMIKCK